MNRFDREHVDGTGDGLSIALGILQRCSTLKDAEARITAALRRAREAKDRDTLRLIAELTDGPFEPPEPDR